MIWDKESTWDRTGARRILWSHENSVVRMDWPGSASNSDSMIEFEVSWFQNRRRHRLDGPAACIMMFRASRYEALGRLLHTKNSPQFLSNPKQLKKLGIYIKHLCWYIEGIFIPSLNEKTVDEVTMECLFSRNVFEPSRILPRVHRSSGQNRF